MIMRPVPAAKSAGTSRNNRAGAAQRKKAAENKCERLILLRGMDTPSKKYLVDDLIVKIEPYRLVKGTEHDCDGTKETKR
jgi:hypothetical protein